jgi:glycosyltransferase involved in cell wall biosynthesis
MQVSVVIPVRDGEAFLAEAIRSVLTQSIPPAEVILVDDGSTDRTAEIARSFPAVTLLHQDKLGQAVARNLGASRATMALLAFLDADDLWTSEKTRQQIETLNDNSNVDIVFGHAIEFSEVDRAGQPIPLGPPMPACLPGAMLIRRDAFWKVGGYSSAWSVGEVVDWYARAVDLNMTISVLEDVVLHRRIHGQNLGQRARQAKTDYLSIMRTVLSRRRKP